MEPYTKLKLNYLFLIQASLKICPCIYVTSLSSVRYQRLELPEVGQCSLPETRATRGWAVFVTSYQRLGSVRYQRLELPEVGQCSLPETRATRDWAVFVSLPSL